MAYRVAGHAIDLGGGIDHVNAVGIAQFIGGHLTGSRLLTTGGSGKGKDAARSHPQHTADDSLLTHAERHHIVLR